MASKPKAAKPKTAAKPRVRKPKAVEKPIIEKVVVYRDDVREWRWKAVATNGEIVADSAEGYRNRAYALKMARALHPETEIEWGPR